jgi:hypothetical protein
MHARAANKAVIRDHREGELEAFVGLPESVGRARRGTLLVRLVEHDVDHNLKAHSSPTSSYKKIKRFQGKKIKDRLEATILGWEGVGNSQLLCFFKA